MTATPEPSGHPPTIIDTIHDAQERHIYIDGTLADQCSQALHDSFGYKEGEMHLASESHESTLTGVWSETSANARARDCYVYAASHHPTAADLMRFTDHLLRCDDPTVVTVLVIPEAGAKSYHGELMVEYARSYGVQVTDDYEGAAVAIESARSDD